MADVTVTGTAATPEFLLHQQYVSGPLAAGAISGTLKGQIRGVESATAADAGLAIAVRLVKNDGTDYGSPLYLIGATPAAPDLLGGVWEFPITTKTNRQFADSVESANITLTSQTATSGDRLVIEVGQRNVSTSAVRTVTLVFGDDSGTDLPEDATTTAANNPWIEFSQTLSFQSSFLPRPPQVVSQAVKRAAFY